MSMFTIWFGLAASAALAHTSDNFDNVQTEIRSAKLELVSEVNRSLLSVRGWCGWGGCNTGGRGSSEGCQCKCGGNCNFNSFGRLNCVDGSASSCQSQTSSSNCYYAKNFWGERPCSWQNVRCSCSNGAGGFASYKGCRSCSSCYNGYYKSGNSCNAKTCKCTGGSPVTGTSCTQNGGEQCASCDSARYKAGDGSCKLKQCTCNGGTAAKGSACEQDGQAYCSSCDANKFRVNGVCTGCKTCGEAGWRLKQACTGTSDAICECDRGYAGSNCAACTVKMFAADFGLSSCKTCPDGSNGRSTGGGTANDGCEVDTCQRPGPPTNAVIVGSSCPESGNQGATCALACVDGYQSSSMTPYKCSPVSGSTSAEYQNGIITCTASTCQRPTLPPNAAYISVSCPENGILHQSTCALTCVDGYTGTDDDQYTCLPVSGSADASYQNGGLTCTASTCQRPLLPPDAAYVEASCPEIGVQGQSTCELACPADGFEVSGKSSYSCLPVSGSSNAEYQNGGITCTQIFTCSCDGGTAGTGYTENCQKCTSCDTGYYKTGSTCNVNKCTCSKGSPVTGPSCSSNGGEQCDHCQDGYYVTGANKCELKECTCSDGQAASGNRCPQHGKAYCASCAGNDKFLINGVCSGCKTCGAGWRLKQACTGTSDAICECDRGYAGSNCGACTGEMFAADFGLPSCKKCPDGSNGRSTGSGTANDGCEADSCQRPAPPSNALIVESSCPENGNQQTTSKAASTCPLACVDGYQSSSMTPYSCKPVSSLTSAEYQDGVITCTASTCQRPAPPTNAAIVEVQCPENGVQGQSTCELACVDGYTSSDMTPYSCLPVSGSSDASYQNGAITCTASTCPILAPLPDAVWIYSESCPQANGIQHQSTCSLACVEDHKPSGMTPYSCLPVSGSNNAAYQNGAITCTPVPPCKVTVYEHWAASADPLKAGFEGLSRTLPEGIGMFPLEDASSMVSSVKVEGEACVAYAYADANCQGQKSQGIAEGVVSGSDALAEKWGCNDCVKCVQVDRIF